MGLLGLSLEAFGVLVLVSYMRHLFMGSGFLGRVTHLGQLFKFVRPEKVFSVDGRKMGGFFPSIRSIFSGGTGFRGCLGG